MKFSYLFLADQKQNSMSNHRTALAWEFTYRIRSGNFFSKKHPGNWISDLREPSLLL